MSGSGTDTEISKVGGLVDQEEDNEEEEENKLGGGDGGGGGGGGGPCVRFSSETVKNKKNNNYEKKKKKDRRGYGCTKEVVLFPFTKAKKYLKKSGRRRTSNCSSSSSSTGNRIIGSCFCSKQPCTLESPDDSPTSDPEDPKFSFEMLRNLIEKNDFYSKECNPHL